MNPSLFARESAVLNVPSAANHEGLEGYAVELSSGNASICNAATDVPFGVILNGAKAGEDDSIGVLGGPLGTVRLKAAAAITLGALLQLTAAGKVTPDAGAGARTVFARALEAGATDELVECVVFNPVAYAS